jgi:hypothetical protein
MASRVPLATSWWEWRYALWQLLLMPMWTFVRFRFHSLFFNTNFRFPQIRGQGRSFAPLSRTFASDHKPLNNTQQRAEKHCWFAFGRQTYAHQKITSFTVSARRSTRGAQWRGAHADHQDIVRLNIRNKEIYPIRLTCLESACAPLHCAPQVLLRALTIVKWQKAVTPSEKNYLIIWQENIFQSYMG